MLVDLDDRAEGILRRFDGIPHEHFSSGDRVRAYIYDVREEVRGPQIFLSRSHPQFMAKLFAQEVPEIYDGIIEIKAVARDPGSRAKIAVLSNESGIDPVGACVGMRGSRVQAVVAELQGEKIDIIQWSSDPATILVNALAPAEVNKVVLREEANRIEVVVPDNQLSLAIGRRGQNVRLASQLTGWDIDILTEAEESDRRNEEFRARSQLLIETLDVDEVIAQLLVIEGHSTVEEIAHGPIEKLADIEGFNEDFSEELRKRAVNYLEVREAELTERHRSAGVTDELAMIEGLNPEQLAMLGEAGIRTVDDLGDLSTVELRGIVGEDGILENVADQVVMAARSRSLDGRRQPESEAKDWREDVDVSAGLDTSLRPGENAPTQKGPHSAASEIIATEFDEVPDETVIAIACRLIDAANRQIESTGRHVRHVVSHFDQA